MLHLKELADFITDKYGETEMALFDERTNDLITLSTTKKYNNEYKQYEELNVIGIKYESVITGGALSVTIEVDKCEESHIATQEKKLTDLHAVHGKGIKKH